MDPNNSSRVDAHIARRLAALRNVSDPDATPPVGDVITRRSNARGMFERVMADRRTLSEVDAVGFDLHRDAGIVVAMTWYHLSGQPQPGPAVLYLHGGGMIMAMAEMRAPYDWLMREYVSRTGVPILLVDYRVAPEWPDPVPVQDCYAAWRWLAQHSEELGVDPGRLAIMGDSAGGGLAAGVSLLIRDEGGHAPVAQLLIYPMLDDRPARIDRALAPVVTWSYADNETGWRALLGARRGGTDVSPYAVPARMIGLTGLPPAYVEVGELDIFRDESVDYARRLAQSGVSTELHIHPGCPHAYDLLAPDAPVCRRAFHDRVRRLTAL